jgi:hypothetical protein
MPPTHDPHDLEPRLRRLPVAPAPASLWDDIQAELRAPDRRGTLTVLRRPLRSPLIAAAAILVAVVGGAAVGILSSFAAPSRWAVRPLAGIPAVAGDALATEGALAVGEWLVTDSVSRARLTVGKLGTADIGPGSRVRLDRGGLTAHRLTVERGSLDAVIEAPPRLFFVRTPAVLATDLGCAYTLEVDSTGATTIHVTAGWVELGEGDAVSLVPAGHVAHVEPGGRPGTPYPEELAPDARAALQRFDAGSGDPADLDLVLAAQYKPSHNITLRRRSAITLWHLLQRVRPDGRARVFEQLAALSAPPPGATREGILALDRRMLERWRADLNPMWSEEAQPWPHRIARRLWNLVIR